MLHQSVQYDAFIPESRNNKLISQSTKVLKFKLQFSFCRKKYTIKNLKLRISNIFTCIFNNINEYFMQTLKYLNFIRFDKK